MVQGTRKYTYRPFEDNKAPFDRGEQPWDLYKKLTYFAKLGTGRPPDLKPRKGIDAPPSKEHERILQDQFEKATNDYYMRLTEIDPDRLRSYEDFEAMEYTPEIASALDIYADESITENEFDQMLVVKTQNERVKSEVERLFYDVLDIKRNMWGWIRAMCKYGNHYLLLDIDEENGIVGHMPLPAKEMLREEAYDGNLNSVRFQWSVQSQDFDAWQCAHFRLLNDDKRYPYGTSILESARKIWKQLTLAEDAMIVYRLTRAPERRIFKIDVGNIDPKDVEAYMKKIKNIMKRTPAVEHTTGKITQKYNVMSVDEDFFIPVRGDRSSDIDTLPGASNMDEIADIEYLQQKLFASMKIPKAFLTYEEDVNAKATLAGQDSRFARTIERIQGSVVAELTKIALIHLYAIGIRDRDQLSEFEIQLTNPNSSLELEQLELLSQRASVISNLWDETSLSPVSLVWALRNIMNFSDNEIKLILKQQYLEGKMNLQMEEDNTPQHEKDVGGAAAPGANANGQQDEMEEIAPPVAPIKPGKRIAPVVTVEEPKEGVTTVRISEKAFNERVDKMIAMSQTLEVSPKTLHEVDANDENPLVGSNAVNNQRTINLLREVDSLISRVDLRGVKKR